MCFPEVGRAIAAHTEDPLQAKPFPGRSQLRMRQLTGLVGAPEQRVEQPRVPNVDLGRPDLAILQASEDPAASLNDTRPAGLSPRFGREPSSPPTCVEWSRVPRDFAKLLSRLSGPIRPYAVQSSTRTFAARPQAPYPRRRPERRVRRRQPSWRYVVCRRHGLEGKLIIRPLPGRTEAPHDRSLSVLPATGVQGAGCQ